MKRYAIAILLIIFAIPFSTYANSYSNFTIGGGINSQVKLLSSSGETEFLDADGFNIFFNRKIPIGSLEVGYEKESYERETYFFFPIKYELTTSIYYMGYNLPINLPLGLSIIPGFRFGLYNAKVEATIMGQSDSNSELYTFAAVAARVQADIIHGFGIYVEGSVKRIISESEDFLKLHAGLKYTFK